jgi:hypothetical protein
MDDKKIAITVENYNKIKKLCEDAEKMHLDKFNFEGSFISTRYAKYLLEYMRDVLKIT